jgi:hypothetical protein
VPYRSHKPANSGLSPFLGMQGTKRSNPCGLQGCLND